MARPRSIGQWFERCLGVIASLLLLRSAFAHLINPYFFLTTVYSYQITGPRFGEWIAIALPFLQLGVGFCLLARLWLPHVYIIACITFGSFLAAQISAVA